MSRVGDALRGVIGRLTPGAPACSHLDQARDVDPRTIGCEECLASGGSWVHLRLCLACGHVGCGDQSPGRHAFHHFEGTGHPIIRSHEPGETWAWCWVDEIAV